MKGVNNFLVRVNKSERKVRDTGDNCPSVKAPASRVANACAITEPINKRKGVGFYENQATSVFRSRWKARLCVRANKRTEDRGSDHRGRRGPSAQLLARSGARCLFRLPFFCALPPAGGADAVFFGGGVTGFSAFSLSINAVNSACICGVARLSQSSRTHCSKYAVRSLKCRSRIKSAIIFWKTPVSRILDGSVFSTARLCGCCSAHRKTKTFK